MPIKSITEPIPRRIASRAGVGDCKFDNFQTTECIRLRRRGPDRVNSTNQIFPKPDDPNAGGFYQVKMELPRRKWSPVFGRVLDFIEGKSKSNNDTIW